MKKKLTLVAIMLLCCVSAVMGESYYKESPQFHQWPDPKAPRYSISCFGPTGIGLELRRPNFTMHITNIEAGSPADGKLKKGQIIVSINGQVLKDVDPRIILGNMITDAEAKDGIMKMMVKDNAKAPARQVIVKIPALGAYSDTWPVNCKKSDKIVRNFADFLAENKDSISIGLDGALLFMLSTGEEKDLDVARKWVKKLVAKYKDAEEINTYPWFAGYNGPALCEYYLRTGDESILPVIKKVTEYLKRTIYNGSWMGRGGCSFGYMAGGHMNAAGVHCVVFLLMAKECGVDVDEHTMQSSLQHFYRYSGHGNVAYGDGVPEGGMVDNGRNTGLAYAMAAAANLSPEGERSVYAKARDINATKGFYSTSWLFHGHTGGGIGELWRGQSMGLIKDKRPAQYRTFMDGRRWMYELARRHDGVFGWVSGWNVSYTDTARSGRGWGNHIPLIYTLPRKQLRLYGAPKTKYSKTYRIPKRPWGTAADEVFYSLIPGEYKPGKRQDIAAERLETDASMQIMARLNDRKVSDDTLLMYAHHIEQAIRSATARSINNQKRYHLVVPLLKSADPRGRQAGLTCMTGMFKGRAMPTDTITDEMFNLAVEMIRDPQESWWVVDTAMNALGRARPELIAPHVSRLAYWLKHEDWWLRKAAMTALTPVATDKRFYKQILPIIGKMIVNNQRPVALAPLRGIVGQLRTADPEVQKYAVKMLGQAYIDFPGKLSAPGGQDMSAGVDYLLKNIATNLSSAPGGFDELYRVSKLRYPDAVLPHKELYLSADPSRFGTKLKEAFKPIIVNELVPEYIGNNRARLQAELTGSGTNGRTVKDFVSLYQKAGIDNYNWNLFGPQRDKIKWDYHTYDPKETKLWERGWRYREVSWPKGMENWFAPDFNAKAAGFEKGYAPFANKGGKLAAMRGSCSAPFCRCGDKPNTFWKYEVLLMRADIKFPPVRKGYSYRLLVGGRSHVNAGDGSDVWINGTLIRKPRHRKGQPTLTGVGKRQGGAPWGVVLSDELLKEFGGGKVTVAVTGFMNIRGNYQTIWLEEMKMPTVTDADIFEAAKYTALKSTEYFVEMDADKMYRWGGKFVSNPKILGKWQVVNQVPTVEEFGSDTPQADLRRVPFKSITFKNNAKTDDNLKFWSGDTLIDLNQNFALKMVLKKIGPAEYLFIEAGQIPRRVEAGWKPAFLVLKRK